MTDEMGNLLQVVEQLNGQSDRLTGYSYDALGRLIKVTDPLAGVAEACYDKHGKVKNTQQVKTKHETTQKSNHHFLLDPCLGVC